MHRPGKLDVAGRACRDLVTRRFRALNNINEGVCRCRLSVCHVNHRGAEIPANRVNFLLGRCANEFSVQEIDAHGEHCVNSVSREKNPAPISDSDNFAAQIHMEHIDFHQAVRRIFFAYCLWKFSRKHPERNCSIYSGYSSFSSSCLASLIASGSSSSATRLQ